MRAGDVVSLRVSTPQGPTDVVGTLVAAGPAELTLRRRDGSTVTIAVDDVVTGRVVPPRPAQTVGVDELQAVMAQGWRPVETSVVGGWLLRAADGFTGRANSALVTADPLPDPRAQLGAVAEWYAGRGLPPRLQVPVRPEPLGLDDVLDGDGWTTGPATHVMTAELASVLRAALPSDAEVVLDDAPDDEWLSLYRQQEGPLPEVAIRVLTNHPSACFVSLREDGRRTAIARVAVDGRWAGLFAVEVAATHRRAGRGHAVTAAALRWAVQQRARRAYLQVFSPNAAAMALWQRLGFAHHHDYVYRTAPTPH